MSRDSKIIKSTRSEILFHRVLRSWLNVTAIWLFLWGSVTLVCRYLLDMDRILLLLWAALPAFCFIFILYFIQRRRLPLHHELLSFLDEFSDSGGLMMASEEVDLGSWVKSIPQKAAPQASWNPRRPLIILLFSLIFSGAALAIPAQEISEDPHKFDIATELEEYEKQIDVLKEEGIIDKEQSEELKEEVDKIDEHAMADDPLQTWEAMDQLSEQLDQKSMEAAAEAMKQIDQLAPMESILEELSKQSAAGNQKLDQALSELSELMQSMAADHNLMKELSKAMEQMKESGQLTEEQMEKLKEALKDGRISKDMLKQCSNMMNQCQGNLEEMLKNLQQASLINGPKRPSDENDGDDGSPGNMPGSGQQQLADFLSKCSGDGQSVAMLQLLCIAPGRGGVNRGKGDAPMTWKDPTSEEGFIFKDKELISGKISTLDESEVSGVSISAPKVEAGKAKVSSGALRGVKSDGGAANKHRILPMHKKAVRTYFERK